MAGAGSAFGIGFDQKGAFCMQRIGAGAAEGMPGPDDAREIEAVARSISVREAAMRPVAVPMPALAGRPDMSVTEKAGATYAALDLGTNNCRLLIARPTYADTGFRIIDSFSRIVRLGEGVSKTGQLSPAAVARTLDALQICHDKMAARHVTRARLIATEACRIAENGDEFVAHVRDKTGLDLEIIDRETEAHLAAAGCAALADAQAEGVLLFDIGGGSSEIIWLARGAEAAKSKQMNGSEKSLRNVHSWASLQLGVVTLAEKFGGYDVSDNVFRAMVDYVAGELAAFAAKVAPIRRCSHFHLLGTSGTVTTIAGVHLNLPRYDRRRVDGLWMSNGQVSHAVRKLRHMTYRERVANGCIGAERADLVLAGCAILEAIRRAFPAERVRIADRGLREGILQQLICADQSDPKADSQACPR
jgi:exopolyphosphatase / guanosine-5'-triphosphate,3'-diphosphate pyrophosphatase